MKLIIYCFIVLLCACSTPKPGTPEAVQAKKEETKKVMNKAIDNMPSWYVKPPTDVNALYERASYRSKDMQMALHNANMLARSQLAVTIEGEISSSMKLFVEEAAIDGSVSAVSTITTVQEVLAGNIAGVQQVETKIMVEDEKYVAYVLIKYPVGEMNKFLMDRIQKDNALKGRLRASKSFKDLEKKVEEYKTKKSSGAEE